ncbi:hypothetical protein BU15DRAFT_67158 [Melanogaster broomeanus]|nr:hypothetical protein BU15DRAFT_67158 [Melanogaster broomeanus]
MSVRRIADLRPQNGNIWRLLSLCDDLEAGAAEAAAIVTLGPTPSVLAAVRVQSEPSPSPGTSGTGHTLVLKSAILDENDKASVALMLKTRLLHESKATVRSETRRVVQLDPKFTLHKTLSSINKDSKMTVQEASHRVRIAQALDSAFVQAKKARELHWQSAARAIAQLVMPQELPNLQTKNVSKLFPLERHSVVIVHSTARFYLGEVLDIYKKGTNNRYGSIDSSECLSNLSFLSLLVYLPLSGETTGLDSAIYEDDDYEDSRPTFITPTTFIRMLQSAISCITSAKGHSLGPIRAPFDSQLKPPNIGSVLRDRP